MGRPGCHTWTLFVLLCWLHVAQVAAGPCHWVVCPAILESGETAKICTSVLLPNETLRVTVALTSKEAQNITLFTGEIQRGELHTCTEFKVPEVQAEDVRAIEMVVRGQNYYSKEVRKVMIRVYKPESFIQTDKPIYMPGQIVQFRVVTLDSKFKALVQQYKLIELQDVNGNRIGQWLNQTAKSKILQLSHALNSEAAEGTYRIHVDMNDDRTTHLFKVEKYVLPKYEVTIDAKDTVNIAQDSFEAKVCAKYTFGQPVPGKVSLSVCRSISPYYPIVPRHPLEGGENVPEITAPCHVEIKQTDSTGCATFTMEVSTFTKTEKMLQDRLEFNAHVEEEGTGISLSQSKIAHISYVIGRLSFIDTPMIYQEGKPVVGKVKAVHYNDTPIVGMKLYLFQGQRWSPQSFQNVTTNSEGIAEFSLCTVDLEGDIYMEVTTSPTRQYPGYRVPHYESADLTLTLAQEASLDSKPSSRVEVKAKDKPLRCGQTEEIFVKYTIAGEQPSKDWALMYMIISKGNIIMEGIKRINILDAPVTQGEVSIKVAVSARLAPYVQILVYVVLPSENVIAHSLDFATEKCFSHKVELQFFPPSAVPGEYVTMQLSADSNSLCGVSAIDKSVNLQEPGKSLNADKIFDLLPVQKVSWFPYQIEDEQPCVPVVRAKRYLPPRRDEEDAYTAFRNVGMKIATPLFVRVPQCVVFRGRTYNQGHGIYPIAYNVAVASERLAESDAGAVGGAAMGPVIETVRTVFPETWIFDLVEIGTREKNLTVKVPDTITTWETEAFCISDRSGFGLAPRREMLVFQPFFLELTLPYSIVRGERFELKATVFNYLSSCIMVSVTPLASNDYTLTPIPGTKYKSCLCGSELKTVRWTLSPSKLGVVEVSIKAEAMTSDVPCGNEIVNVPVRGRIDLVKKPLRVKAEGIQKTDNFNWLFSPKEGQTVEEIVTYNLPANVIRGSERGSVSVLGDIMGRALKNVDKLLRMPYGCGEQNMALLAPNIYILQYLKNTDQLTAAIKEKSLNFLTSGYQRQLNYKLYNGAYSTFGSEPGNTWLTAFVMRTFVKAQSFIYIDPKLIQESKDWLQSLQNKNGCFRKVGSLFNNRMKGGVSDEVTLTTYIVAALLEMNSSVADEVVKKSLSCLRESMHDKSNTYTTALMAYVFTLAGDMRTRAALLQHLDSVAVDQGGFLHWTQTSTETSAMLSVEISAYVVLATLSVPAPTTEEKGYATRIVRWLTQQQNHYGGFSSTQDTVVALQALALYSSLVLARGGSSTVSVTTPGRQLQFSVNPNNKLLYQEEELTSVDGTYRIQTTGTAPAVVQLSFTYNVPTPARGKSFNIEVNTRSVCTGGLSRPRLTLDITATYNGKQNVTNMVIVRIDMLSGFTPQEESLKRLRSLPAMDRVDEKEGHVDVYIQMLPKGLPMEFSLDVIRVHLVQNLKPAVVKTYDYYQTDDQAQKEYSYPCVNKRVAAADTKQ